MIGKKINQLATELAPLPTDLTIIGDPTTGVSKKITLEQISSLFGGSVSFYTNLASFPAVGNIDIIYCAKDTNKLYLWGGSSYVEVFPSQSLLNTYQLRSEKGNANGYASLDSLGKVPISQLPSSLMEYKGTWNAATNTPTLANGTGDTGDVYICNVAGTVNFGAGPITFAVGDYTIYSGSIWQRSSGAVGTVTSVAVSRSGDALAITGSPITTSGTINIGFAGTGAQYIKGDGTLATFPSIISQATNLITEVYNNSGATLTKGTIVYINGGQGNLPTVAKALATGDSTSAQTFGVVQADITNMNNGYVVVAGRISDLDTQVYANGTQLYLSPTTAGTWTSTKPYAPQHLVYVGIVVRAHPTQGVVEVKIQNGYEMDELHNVAAQSPDNNDILQYKTSTSLWTKVAGTTSNIAEGSNLYYTDARSRAALSFTAGSGAYNSTTGVITIPTNTNQLTNGAAYITLASLSAGAGISYNNTTGVIASTITQYTDAMARAAISLTTTGTSGAATYNSTTGVLNVPQYAPDLSGYVPTSRTLTINGTAFDLSANRSWSVGTVTSVGLSSATSGVTIGSTPVTTSGTITLAIATASGSQQGLLSSTDWTTFNNKQSALTNPVTGTGTTNYLPKFTGTSTIGNSLVFDNGTTVFINATTAPALGSPEFFVKMGTANSYEGILVASSSNNNVIAIAHTGSIGLITTNYGTSGSNTPLAFGTNGAEQMRLDATGNLMVGSANAGNAGSINVSVGLAGTTSGGLQLWAATNQTHYIQFGDATTGASPYTGYVGYAHSTDSLIFGTATSTRMTLNASGNLGLGVTPSAWVDYKGFQIGNQGSIGATSTVINFSQNVYYGASGNSYIENGKAAMYQMNDGVHGWRIAGTGTAGNAISFTQAMTLNASGNLSIGNTNDSYKLDVSGSVRITGNLGINGVAPTYPLYVRVGTNQRFRVVDGGSGYTQLASLNDAEGAYTPIMIGNSWLSIASTGAATFSSSAENVVTWSRTSCKNWSLSSDSAGGYFKNTTDSVIPIYMTNAGNVGIGTTSPGSLLDVTNIVNTAYDASNTLISGQTMRISNTSATSGISANLLFVAQGSGGGNGLGSISGVNTGTGSLALTFGTRDLGGSVTERMRITSGGNVLVGKTTNAGGKLQVSNGTITFNVDYNADGAYLTAATDNNVNYRRLSYDATDHVFLTSATERMRITSGGNVEINTGSIKTGEPDTGLGRAAIKIGASVSGAAFNVTRYLPVSVDGTVYYINLNSSTP